MLAICYAGLNSLNSYLASRQPHDGSGHSGKIFDWYYTAINNNILRQEALGVIEIGSQIHNCVKE
jgi:hypothetical protein